MDHETMKRTHKDLMLAHEEMRLQSTSMGNDLVAVQQILAEVEAKFVSAEGRTKEAVDENATLRTQNEALLRENTIFKQDMAQMGHERDSDDQEGNNTNDDSDA